MSIKSLFLISIFILNLWATERIVALSPSVNEIIFALGEGDKIVGNTEYCKYPKESLAIPKVGGYFSPSLEKVLALDPSIVIMQENNFKLSQKLKQLGIRTEIIKIDTLFNIKDSILNIGKILKKENRAKEILISINTGLENLKNITKNKKILIVFGHNTSLSSRIFVAGQNLYFDEIINISGNTNALQSKRKGQPILNMENIIACNPDIVILLSHSMREKSLSREELINPWRELPISAGKSDSIYIINKLYAGIPSDRLVYFLRDFSEILHNYEKKRVNASYK